MLFQQIYNLIKYKTLPSSFLFKNRLFIERDSKNKRILTNFGLIFRNSKWSQYENYNIKQSFSLYFFKIIKYFLFLLAISLYFYNYELSFFYIFNFFSLVFWLSLEIAELYFVFFVWLFGSFFVHLINFFLSFFINNFFIKIDNSFLISKSNSTKSFKNISRIKENLNWQIYYSISNLSNERLKASFIKNLFDFNVSKDLWSLNYFFFHSLFKLNYLLNKNSTTSNFFFINNILKKETNNNLGNFFFNTKLITYSLWFFFNKNNNFYDKTYKNKKRFLWNLHNVFIYNDKNYSLQILKNTIFFFTKNNLASYSIFNNELLLVFQNITKTSLISSKWDRWLYKYSLINRKFIKNSHKNTLTKSMLSNNKFYSNFSEKNIWNSEYFSKINSQSNFFFYFINSNKKNTKDLFLKDTSYLLFDIKNINNLEYSYFWFIKKFFNFNSNTLNKLKLMSTIKSDVSNEFFFFNNDNSLNIKNALKMYNYQLNGFFFKEHLNLYSKSDFKNNFFLKNTVCDFYLSLDNNNFFLDEHISTLVAILDSNLNINKSYNFLNYNSKLKFNKNKKFFFINKTSDNDNFLSLVIKSNFYNLCELNLNKDLFFINLINK